MQLLIQILIFILSNKNLIVQSQSTNLYSQVSLSLGANGVYGFEFNNSLLVGSAISAECITHINEIGVAITQGYHLISNRINSVNLGVKFSSNNNSVFYLDMIQAYCKPDLINSALTELYKRSTRLFLGPSNNNLTFAAIDFMKTRTDTLLISPSSNDPALFTNDPAGINVVGLMPPPDQYITSAINFLTYLNSLGQSSSINVAVLDDGTTNYCPYLKLQSEFSKTANVKLTKFYNISTNASLETAMAEIKAGNTAVIFGCTNYTLCVSVPKEARKINYNPNAMLFTDCLTYDYLSKDLGDDAEYLFGLYPWSPDDMSGYRSTYTNLTAPNFKAMYTRVYGKVPTFYSAAGYSAGELLASAIEKSPDFKGSARASDLYNTIQTSGKFSLLFSDVSFSASDQSSVPPIVSQYIKKSSNWIQQVVFNSSFLPVANVTFPIPTFAQRDCKKETSNCNNNGECNRNGQCECFGKYYGKLNNKTCDTLCDGTYNKSSLYKCIPNREFYLIGLVPSIHQNTTFKDEYESVMKFTVELINNQTFANETSLENVKLKLKVIYTNCSSDGGEEAYKESSAWASANNIQISGFIGAMCSSASRKIATGGQSEVLPLISWGSTSTGLSDKTQYPYFFRVIANDGTQSIILSNALRDLKINTVSVIHSEDSYSINLALDFVKFFQNTSISNQVLLNKQFNSTSYTTLDYQGLLTDILEAGASSVFLASHETPSKEIFQTAKTFKDFSMHSQDYIWLGADGWVVPGGGNEVVVPIGSVGTFPFTSSTSNTNTFLNLWRTADPKIYIDGDNDRSKLDGSSYYIIDCIVAYAKGFQATLNKYPTLENKEFRLKVVEVLANDVDYLGVSGNINFDANGDIDIQTFAFANLQKSAWVDIGSASKTTSQIRFNEIVWPNGQKNSSGLYSQQQPPICGPGYEPTTTGSFLSCTACVVGTYKYYTGSDPCLVCPTGASCNDVGVTLPCIQPGYWRYLSNDANDLGDFNKYPIYTCYLRDSCIGNCYNSSSSRNLCADSSLIDSPTCGVCASNYYRLFSRCNQCEAKDNTNEDSVFGILSFIFLLIVFASLFFIKHRMKNVKHSDYKDTDKLYGFRSMTATLKLVLSFLQIITGAVANLNANFTGFLNSVIEGLFYDPLSSIISSLKCSGTVSDAESQLIKVEIGFWMPFIFISTVLIASLYTIYHKFHMNLSNFIPNSRLIISSAYSGEIEIKSKNVEDQRNPIQEGNMNNSDDIANQEKNDTINTSPSDAKNDKLTSDAKFFFNITNSFFYLMNWTFLFIYPFLSTTMLTTFECRDLGNTGNFMKQNYAIECEGHPYKAILAYCSFGIILYTFGILVYFQYVITYRYSYFWSNASKILYEEYNSGWVYFEIYNCLMKLLVTSVFVYAGTVASSQSLFLFSIGLINFVIVYSYNPYKNYYDGLLASAFAFIHMCLFFLMLISTSDIGSQGDFNIQSLQDYIGVSIVLAISLIMPINVCLKIPYVSNRIDIFIKENF